MQREKAKELVKKFMSIDSDSEQFDGFKMGFFYAQRCALIAVDEIINIWEYSDTQEKWWWQQVRKEIEKL